MEGYEEFSNLHACSLLTTDLISWKSQREKPYDLQTFLSDFSCFLLLFFQLSQYFIMLQENMETVTITGRFKRESKVSQKIRSEKVKVGRFVFIIRNKPICAVYFTLTQSFFSLVSSIPLKTKINGYRIVMSLDTEEINSVAD